MLEKVCILSAKRTPIGAFQGGLSSLSAPELGSLAILQALDAASVSAEMVDDVYMGNVLTAGVGQAPARQAALKAGLPFSVPCTTVGKVCGSGLKAFDMGVMAIQTGRAQTVVVGGMESMSNAPYLLPQARNGLRFGHGDVLDSMIKDGLWDVYNDFHMGSAAELCAKEHGLGRKEQDAYAVESYQRAQAALASGAFSKETFPVDVSQGKKSWTVTEDEEPSRVNFDKLPALRPAFDKDGTVTAANASSINDGAAALVLMSEAKVKELKLTPIATFGGSAQFAKAPEWFTTAPADAVDKLVKDLSWSKESVDCFEINEAFSVVSLACNKILDLDPKKVNVHGGAVALGHPIGASGARILVTLIHALREKNLKRGVASLCIGGGEAIAVGVEA